MAESTQQPSSQPPAPQQPVAPNGYVENPGQTLGIIGIVLNAVGINIGGIILGAMSRSKSKQANMPTTLGTVSLVWGIVGTILGALAILFWIIMMILAAANSDDYRRDYITPSPSSSQSTGAEPESL